MATQPCGMCGLPTSSKYGICARTTECRRENSRRYRATPRPPEYEPCEVCGWPTRAASGVCRSTEECSREAKRRQRAANLDTERDRGRQYLRRTDRACRYAKTGCTNYAAPGYKACRDHANNDQARRAKRKDQRLKLKLVARDGWLCAWCSDALPQDLHGTHLDHIIPRSRGGPDIEMNLQVLHGTCNDAKNAKITPAALDLADRLGMTLVAA